MSLFTGQRIRTLPSGIGMLCITPFLSFALEKTILIAGQDVAAFGQRQGITLADRSEADLLARQEAA